MKIKSIATICSQITKNMYQKFVQRMLKQRVAFVFISWIGKWLTEIVHNNLFNTKINLWNKEGCTHELLKQSELQPFLRNHVQQLFAVNWSNDFPPWTWHDRWSCAAHSAWSGSCSNERRPYCSGQFLTPDAEERHQQHIPTQDSA